jgi:hypothetical protein
MIELGKNLARPDSLTLGKFGNRKMNAVSKTVLVRLTRHHKPFLIEAPHYYGAVATTQSHGNSFARRGMNSTHSYFIAGRKVTSIRHRPDGRAIK